QCDRRCGALRARADASRAVRGYRRQRRRAIGRRCSAQEPRRTAPRGDGPASDGLREPAARSRARHWQGARRALAAPGDRAAVMATLKRKLVDWSATVVLVVIPILVLRASLARGTPSTLDQALLRITAPLQAGVSWAVEGVGGLWSHYVALIDVEDENRELRADNDRLRQKLAAVTRQAFDVQALE